ncbi:methionine sulfoxide [Schizosaccharomyces japonicus yFS275]|uniref:Peptide-methionine (R)-S-oxide reductase n=1 Tax=Schizosaccharomyces japonicus (strain yFS275 / FY16936) TaxID=402676 RepID=B6JVF5_SCHJY|nr:methionine sulfoxide [Schizosaccharomyces japonicus yFS275]EEB05356.2 methionine sulfoxide [Schizosaccharomyces japonicus yFS275]
MLRLFIRNARQFTNTRRLVGNQVFFPVAFFSSKHQLKNHKMSFPLQKSEDEWRLQLSPEQFRVLRQKATEPPGSGKYDKTFPTEGLFCCAGCGEPLYIANSKFNSKCGWPAFFEALPGKVKRIEDTSFGMTRTEAVCANCGGHLGHIFKGEGYPTPTNERHCINSVSLRFHTEHTFLDGLEDADKQD